MLLVIVPPVPTAIYRKRESCKKRSNEARICEIEQSSFTHFNIFSHQQLRSTNILLPCFWINGTQIMQCNGVDQCFWSFSLLRSAIKCLRASRSSKESVPTCTLGSSSIYLIQLSGVNCTPINDAVTF